MQTTEQNSEKMKLDSTRAKSQQATVPIRIRLKTKKILGEFVKKGNSKKYGRTLKCDDFIIFALKKLNDSDLTSLQEQSISNQDRFEIAFRKMKARRKDTSRDEFLGMVLKGEILLRE